MQLEMRELDTWYDREMKQGLLSALGLDASEEVVSEQTRMMDEYGLGLASVRRSLRLDAATLKEFDEMVKRSITICRDGWPSIRKHEVRAKLTKGKSSPAPHIDRAIDLGIRIWLMLDCCVDESTGFSKRWADDEEICECFNSRFDTADASEDGEPITRFPRKFRGVNLHQLGDITVQWTSYLDEHLRFDEDNREVKIFNNKAWLNALLNRPTVPRSLSSPDGPGTVDASEKPGPSRKETGVPRELILETIKTLDVLFPPWHTPTEKFLASQGQVFHLQDPIPRDVPRLREFKFWRYRLLDLIVEYESPPLDWKHIWKDRRNPAAFWTFWIGIAIFLLTLIFGIASSVLAGIQIELAEPTHAAGNQ